MSLQDKYRAIIDTAAMRGVQDFQAREHEGVLHIDGTAPSTEIKDELWSIYEGIDPTYAAGDMMMNIQVGAMAPGAKAKVVTRSSNLNVRQGAATDEPVIGKARHHSYVTLIAKTNDQWWHIRTEDGVEGYCYAQYLSVEE